MEKKWKYKRTDISNLLDDVQLTGIPQSSLQILTNRGIDKVEDILKFLFNGLDNLYDTRLMKDAEKAVKIIIECIKNGFEIVIYTDYDSDGACGGAVAVKSLKNLGVKVHVYSNNRFTQGYGLQDSGIDEIKKLYPDVKLIITVDNGIMAHKGIDYAKSLGYQVIVTDHHEQGDTLPDADAVVDPKRKDDTYPFKGLCGAGVVFKLMLLLYWEMGEKLQYVYNLLDIVAVATVGDIVPIIDENRIIVKEGLKKIREEKRQVFRLFREITEVTDITSHYTLGFIYVPMINAIGRLEGDIQPVIEMLISEDENFIESTIKHMKEVNETRKEMTEEQYAKAEEILSQKSLKNVIVLFFEDFHEGIIGLIAGRLKEKYNRPVVVFTRTEQPGVLKASARSIDGFHLKENLDRLKQLTIGYGGHAKAAGLSINEEDLDDFEDAIVDLGNTQLTKEDLMKVYNIDLILDANKVDIDIVDELRLLEPFGEGFPKPIIRLGNFKVDKVLFMGEEKNHVKLVSKNISMIMWRNAEAYKDAGEPTNVTALGYPQINVYQNNVSLQFTVDNDNFVDMDKIRK